MKQKPLDIAPCKLCGAPGEEEWPEAICCANEECEMHDAMLHEDLWNRPLKGGRTPVEYLVGNYYETLAGKLVKVVQRSDVPGYECVMGKDGKWRYNRPQDHGRVTGSTDNDPDNFVRLYK